MKLTDYESDILYLAKGHFQKEKLELGLDFIDLIKALRMKYYLYDPNTSPTLFYFKDNLVELSVKLNLLSSCTKFNYAMSSSYFDAYFDKLPTPCTIDEINKAIVMKNIYYLLSMLANVEIQEKVNDEWIPIIEMTEKDSSFIQTYVDFLKEQEAEKHE